MPIAQYTIGPPKRPAIHHDNGHLDYFSPRPPNASDYAQLAKWLAILEGGEEIQDVPGLPHNELPDALPAYRHFLMGQGADRTFSYERFVASDTSGKTILKNAINDARQGAEAIYLNSYAAQASVHFQMTGSAIAIGNQQGPLSAIFPYPATENWQKAIGWHVIWMSAEVDVKMNNGVPQYAMIMTLHAEDRFNFNPGMKDIATGIPDAENGVLEISGLAHQYMNYGTLQRTVTWDGTSSSQMVTAGSTSGRERKPGDNVRIRNRL